MESWYEKGRIAELVAKSCRILGKLDLTYGAIGHVSYRLDGGTILIKAKGPDEASLRTTAPRDIIEIDLQAGLVVGPEGLQPPGESFIHTAIYEAFPAARSVIHCHSKFPVLMSICDKPILPLGSVVAGLDLAIEGIPTYPFSHMIDSKVRGDALAGSMGNSGVVIQRGHGVSIYGSSVEDATVRAIALNELASINYMAHLLGDPRAIADSEAEEYMSILNSRRVTPSAGGPGLAGRTELPPPHTSRGVMSSWRHYCELAEEQSEPTGQGRPERAPW
jgi:ribulose-5-phosphate 4-epimerase/fuculose-1-phosphate aldolase